VKVALGMQPYDGPWGGGNRFVAALNEGLKDAGHEVVHQLTGSDIDVALMIDPRVRSPNVTFGPGALFRHVSLRSPKTIAVHRINECDERKGGRHLINAKLVRANYAADATAFVGAWLKELPVWRQNLRPPNFVVRNGADTATFNAMGYRPWDGKEPLRLVTHHWGYDPNKGFDIYRLLDDMLDAEEWRSQIAFSYVGNLPRGFAFRNVRYVAPLNGQRLAAELRSHHAYVTGSINEPGGNHQNEGALCGLPLLYRRSGCLPEYCEGYGIEFSGPGDFPDQLQSLFKNYDALAPRMGSYPHTAARMVSEWIALFEHLVERREELVAARPRRKSGWSSLRLALSP
jgi:hypothetical protein